ncbi:MAG: ATP-binding protein [Sandaracinaceae bacterium]|nr:ATP-binding protein [Sandaracinaceae bacterium]
MPPRGHERAGQSGAEGRPRRRADQAVCRPARLLSRARAERHRRRRELARGDALLQPDASDEARGTATVSVRDDGCGMGREILEEQLTVLFRSGKEGRRKIGKFGVGFVSVLAVQPKLVAVKSSQGKGEQWTLHLHPDQTYELFRAEGGGASGTTVTLHVPMEKGALASFVEGTSARSSRGAGTSRCRSASWPASPERARRCARCASIDPSASTRSSTWRSPPTRAGRASSRGSRRTASPTSRSSTAGSCSTRRARTCSARWP